MSKIYMGDNGPQLVTLEGDCSFGDDPAAVFEYMGIDPDDADMLTGDISPEDIEYLNAKYPELMGVWPILAKIGKGLLKVGGKAIKGIAARVRQRRAARKAKSNTASTATAEKNRQAEVNRQRLIQEAAANEKKKSDTQKTLSTILPIAAMAAMMLLK